MENEFVQDDTSNISDQDTEIVLQDDTTEEVDVAALIEQNKKLFERAKRAEGFVKQPDGSWVKREKSQPKINNNAEVKPYNILEDEVADLILDGYTKEETKFILANGGRKALDNKDSYVAVAINAKREQRKTEEAVSQTTSNGFVAPGGKSYTPEQLANMSVEELERVLPHA